MTIKVFYSDLKDIPFCKTNLMRGIYYGFYKIIERCKNFCVVEAIGFSELDGYAVPMQYLGYIYSNTPW